MWVIRADHLRPGMVLANGGKIQAVTPQRGGMVCVKADLTSWTVSANGRVNVASLGPHSGDAYLLQRQSFDPNLATRKQNEYLEMKRHRDRIVAKARRKAQAKKK